MRRRSPTGYDNDSSSIEAAAVKNALAEAGRSLRDIKALDVVSVGLRGDNMDSWGALCRISFLVDNVDS
jgi:flavin-binding protein dodecin